MLFSQVFLMLDEFLKSKEFKTEDKDLNGKTKTTKTYFERETEAKAEMGYYDRLEKKSSKDWGSTEPPPVFFQLCVFRVILFPSVRTESLEQVYKYH